MSRDLEKKIELKIKRRTKCELCYAIQKTLRKMSFTNGRFCELYICSERHPRVNFYDLPQHILHMDNPTYYRRYFDDDEEKLKKYWSNRLLREQGSLNDPYWDAEDGVDVSDDEIEFLNRFHNAYRNYRKDDESYQEYLVNEDLVNIQEHMSKYLSEYLRAYYKKKVWGIAALDENAENIDN